MPLIAVVLYVGTLVYNKPKLRHIGIASILSGPAATSGFGTFSNVHRNYVCRLKEQS